MLRWISLGVVVALLVAPAAEAKAKRSARKARPRTRVVARQKAQSSRLVAASRGENAKIEALYGKYQALLQRRQALQDSGRNEGMAAISQFYQNMANAQVTPLPGGRPNESVWRLRY